MQNGMKAGLAITLAVFLTGIVGFLTAVVPVEEDRTYYTQVSDLTPIIDHTDIDSYTEYNPLTNVSGWVDKPGTVIPYLTSGISAYPYRHYVQSEQYLDGNTTVYMSALEDIGGTAWSSERAYWYPLAKVSHLHSNISETVTYNGVTAKCISNGHITIETDVLDGDLVALSFFVGHYDENHILIHGFTRTYVYSAGAPITNVYDTITSVSDLDSAPSHYVPMDLLANDTGLDVYLEVNVSLPAGHRVEATFITAQRINDTGIAGDWLDMYNGVIVDGVGSTTPAGQYIKYNGGIDWFTRWSSSHYVHVDHTLKLNGVSVDTSIEAYTIVPLSQHLTGRDVEDGTTFFSTNPLYHGTYSWSESSDLNQVSGGYTAELTSYSGYICYDEGTDRWYPAVLSESGLYYEPDIEQVGYRTDEIYIVAQGYLDTITGYGTYPVYEYKYVDANQFVKINNGSTGSWKNYMDSTVGGRTITKSYQNGKVTLLTEPGTTITTAKAVWKDLDGNTEEGTMTVTVPSSIPYSMALVTLDFQSGEYYAQGVVWGAIDAADRTTNNWTLRPYQYMMSPAFVKEGIPTSDSPSYIEGLQFTKSGGTRVFIVSTSVMTDPLGRLWGDPTVYLAYYFPDYFTFSNGNTGVPTTAIRVLFNGFVSYGDSLTINGQYMPIEDGKITFTYYTTETIRDETTTPPTETTVTVTNTGTFPVKGMAVDWEDGHVYLVFTEKGTTRYDLGAYDESSANVVIDGVDTTKDTIATDIIKGTGVWYWQSNLYTISHATETVLHLDLSQGLNGWGMSIQVSMLLFAAMLILGTALTHYFYRDSDEPMSILDWVIIGAAILLSLGVAMI